jgi:hypothetical protein
MNFEIYVREAMNNFRPLAKKPFNYNTKESCTISNLSSSPFLRVRIIGVSTSTAVKTPKMSGHKLNGTSTISKERSFLSSLPSTTENYV